MPASLRIACAVPCFRYPRFCSPAARMQSCGSTCVLVAVQQVLVGVIAVMDPIKPEAR